MDNSIIRYCFFLLGSMLFAQTSHASTFSYERQDLGANSYRYVYTIDNDGTLPSSGSIKLFDILFDPSIYSESSLHVSSNSSISTGWSEQLLASAPNLNLPAAYDVLTNDFGIAVGAKASGFSVDFTWLGVGLPGSQSFEIYDPVTFMLLETGTTQALTSVPLPNAFFLFVSSFIGLVAFDKSFRFKKILQIN